MNAWGWIWFLVVWPVQCGHGVPAREEYLRLIQEKEHLVYANRKLNLEEKAIQSKAPYLVIDLGSGQIAAKSMGLLLRSTVIDWSFRSRLSEEVSAVFQIEERIEVVAPGDTTRVNSGSFRRLWEEFPVAHRLRFREGPELWITGLPPMESRLDTLLVKTGAWLRHLPGIVENQRIQVFVAVKEVGWIKGVAEGGNWVVVILPGPEGKRKESQDTALTGKILAQQSRYGASGGPPGRQR